MKYLIPLVFLALPAHAQTDPAGAMRIGDHQHGLPDFVSQDDFNDLKALVDDMGAVLEEHVAGEPVDPPIDPPIPPGDFMKLCAKPGTILCDGFENGPKWDFFNVADAGQNPSIVMGGFNSDNAFQLVLDGNGGPDVSGSVAYDIPAQNTVYMHAMIKFEAGLHENLSRFTGTKGPKHFQFVEQNGSCSGDSVNIVNSQNRNVWVLTNGCSGANFRTETPGGDKNLQPISDTDFREFLEGACTYRHLSGNTGPKYGNPGPRPNPANCVIYEDDVWNRVELRISVGEGVKLWVNGALVINMTRSDGAGGIDFPRRRLFLTGYMTSHQSGNPANESWRVWYDNLIISTECITSC